MDLMEISIEQFHQAIKTARLTCLELVNFYLDRINQYDAVINSIICLNPLAKAEAESLDRAYQQTGQLIGPLHGVPVLLKDNIETENLPTTAGSLSLQGYHSNRDATIVKKLKEAGAIILAKTNLHEFAIWGETISSIKGQTLNPYDLTRTPGGSSGGTGAAVAANFGLVGIGTDTINSIRSPASANALVGLRPSMGRVSRHGIVPYSLTQDTAGPITRTVEDAWKVFLVIQGYDPFDQITALANSQKPEPEINPLSMSLKPMPLKGKRLGVLHSFFGKEQVNQSVNKVIGRNLSQLLQAGVLLLDIDEQIDSNDLVQNLSVHVHDFKDHLNHYLASAQTKFKSVQEIIESGLFHPGIREHLIKANQLTTDSQDYHERLNKQHQLRNQIMSIITENHLDALVYPHQQRLVCKVGDSQLQRNGVLAAITGFPSISIQSGFSEPTDTAPIGLPVGMELLGKPFDEQKICAVAKSIEQLENKRIVPNEVLQL